MTRRRARGVITSRLALRGTALACLGGVGGIVLWAAMHRVPEHGDSAVLVRGARAIVDCVRDGRLTGCDRSTVHTGAGPTFVTTGPFPVLQYLPAIAVRLLGGSVELTLRLLALLNVAAFAAILVLARTVTRRLAPRLWSPIVLAALVASPLLYYAKSTLGEELSAALILGATAAALLGARPLVLGPLVLLACIAKETNPPFVLALAAACVLARTVAGDPARRRALVAVAVGSAAGLATNSAFNVVRYGTVRNRGYMRSALYVHDPAVFARIFAAEWFAPNAGLSFFWPLALVLVVLLVGVAAVRGRGAPATRAARAATVAVGVLFLGQLALLAAWWAPFGWYAWGPRLIVPFVPAFLVAAVATGGAAATPAVARFLRGRGLYLATAAVVALGLPEMLVLYHGLALTEFFAGARGGTCVNSSVFTATARYYSCLGNTAWTTRPWMLQTGARGLHGWGWLGAAALTGAVVSLAALARRAAREAGSPASPPAAPAGAGVPEARVPHPVS